MDREICQHNRLTTDYCIVCHQEYLMNISDLKETRMGFVTKDSGERQEFSTGMKRDVQTDKPRYDLIGSGWNLIKRWAELVGRGAIKYGELNFEKAATEEEMNRFKSSAMRHMVQWQMGETDEDHAAAVCFNIAGYEMVMQKMRNTKLT